MLNSHTYIQHFILSRFNLRLWRHDKNGEFVRTETWLEHRCALFEMYCLPSMVSQTCKDFKWIILFDDETPGVYKQRIANWQVLCPQLIPVFVKPKDGRYFAQVFRMEVVTRMKGEWVLTTYLDNDDAFSINFVEDLQMRARTLENGTFICYNEGYQYYTDFGYLMKINNRRNHFVSVLEKANACDVKTIYGYGSHYFIEKIPGVIIEYVKDSPMWCEVIHEKNMDNDAYFLFGSKLVGNKGVMQRDFGLDVEVRSGCAVYLFRFLPRYVRTLVRRIGYFFRGRRW